MSDNQLLNDQARVNYLTTAISAFQARTVTPSGAALDVAENRECGAIAGRLADEKNRLNGVLTQTRPSTGSNASSEGGSKVSQPNVGAKQW
jgi:hypothetical protein